MKFTHLDNAGDAYMVDVTEKTPTVRTADRTGVEMEALTAVNVAALAIIDMVKGVDRSAFIRRCGIVAKSCGRSGDWSRELPR